MAGIELNGEEVDLLLEALLHTREEFEKYDRYPSEAFRRERLAVVDGLVVKLRDVR